MVIWLFKPFPPQPSTWFVYDPFPYINSLLTLNMIQLVHHNTRKLTSGQASASYRMRRKFLFRSINIAQTIGARGPFINYVDKEKGGRLAKCQEYYIILCSKLVIRDLEGEWVNGLSCKFRFSVVWKIIYISIICEPWGVFTKSIKNFISRFKTPRFF